VVAHHFPALLQRLFYDAQRFLARADAELFEKLHLMRLILRGSLVEIDDICFKEHTRQNLRCCVAGNRVKAGSNQVGSLVQNERAFRDEVSAL